MFLSEYTPELCYISVVKINLNENSCFCATVKNIRYKLHRRLFIEKHMGTGQLGKWLPTGQQDSALLFLPLGHSPPVLQCTKPRRAGASAEPSHGLSWSWTSNRQVKLQQWGSSLSRPGNLGGKTKSGWATQGQGTDIPARNMGKGCWQATGRVTLPVSTARAGHSHVSRIELTQCIPPKQKQPSGDKLSC